MMSHKSWAPRLMVAVAATMSSLTAAAVEHKTLTLDSSGLQSLRIDADAGFLHIQGVPGETIEVTAEIEAKSDHYRLTLDKSGSNAVLVADLDDSWGSRRQRIDLTVKVPERLLLDIDDDSGEIIMSGMRANAKIDDDSGAIVVKDHRGNLDIDDDSGEIELESISGNVSIDDDSGSIGVKDVTGNVTIHDGSGGIRVTNVSGHVTVRDGSGGITVAKVKQGLTILEGGSGGLNTSEIEGGVDIRE